MPNLSRHRQHPALVALGDALRAARIAKKWSQEELADAADVAVDHIGRIERGDSNAAYLTLVKLCEALEVNLSAIVKKAGN